MSNSEDLLYVEDMTREYRFNASTLRVWRSKNVGPPSFTLGPRGRVVYRRTDVERWLANQERESRRGDGDEVVLSRS